MPKKKSYPYRLAYPKTPNPLKEMSFCHSIHIYVSCEIQGFKVGKEWEMGDKYCLTIRSGGNLRKSEYLYTKENVVDAIYDTYREIYKRKYAKQAKVNGD